MISETKGRKAVQTQKRYGDTLLEITVIHNNCNDIIYNIFQHADIYILSD